jgi:hypothetical protein
VAKNYGVYGQQLGITARIAEKKRLGRRIRRLWIWEIQNSTHLKSSLAAAIGAEKGVRRTSVNFEISISEQRFEFFIGVAVGTSSTFAIGAIVSFQLRPAHLTIVRAFFVLSKAAFNARQIFSAEAAIHGLLRHFHHLLSGG